MGKSWEKKVNFFNKKLKKSKKIEKKVQKNVQNSTLFFNSCIGVKIGKFRARQNFTLKIRLIKMLKWARWERRGERSGEVESGAVEQSSS
jgi:hypothetical protein